MEPVLLTIGPFTVYTLGAFLAFSYLLSIFSFWRAGRKEGFSSDGLLDLVFVVTFSALLAGRLAFLVFIENAVSLAEIFKVGEGFMWVGAFLAGSAALVIFAKAKNWSLFRITDNVVAALAIGQAFGFLGAEMVNYLPFAFYPAFGYLFLWIFLRYLRVKGTKIAPTFSYLAVSGLLIALVEWLRPAKALWTGVNLNYASGVVLVALGIIGLVLTVAKKSIFKVKIS